MGRGAGEVHSRLPGRVAPAHHDDFLFGAQRRFHGGRCVVDALPFECRAVGYLKFAIARTGGATTTAREEML